MTDFPHATGTFAALAQGIRLLISAGMIAVSSKVFTGTMKPIAVIISITLLVLTMLYSRVKNKKIGKPSAK